MEHSINLVNGTKPVPITNSAFCLKKILIIGLKKHALKEVKKNGAGLVLWTDRSKLEMGNIGAIIC